MNRQEYIELICRILMGSSEPVERPLPDPVFNQVVGFAIETRPNLDAWRDMCYASLNGQAEPIIADVFAIIRAEARQGEVKPTFDLLSFEALLARPPKEWIFEKLLGVRDFAMMFGLPGSGKTFIGLDMIMAMITGRDFAGHFKNIRPAKVLYCTDEGVEGLPARFKAVAEQYGVKPDPGLLRICLTMPQLFLDVETGWQHFLNDVVGNFEPDFIFLDTLFNTMVGAKENVADDASVAIHNAKAIRDALKCGLGWFHHANKANEWPRGTSAWIGSMDLIIQTDAGVLSCFKAKDAPGFTSLAFEIVGTDDSAIIKWTGLKEQAESMGEVIFQFLRANPGQQYTAKELADIFDIASTSNIPRLLASPVARHLIKTTLRNLERPASKTNPMLYYCPDPHAGITFSSLNAQ